MRLLINKVVIFAKASYSYLSDSLKEVREPEDEQFRIAVLKAKR